MLFFLILRDLRRRTKLPFARTLMLSCYMTALCVAPLSGQSFPPPRLYHGESFGAHPTAGWNYDLDGDGKTDYRKRDLDNDGAVDLYLYDDDRDGSFERVITKQEMRDRRPRHLIICVDSVPFFLMEELWREGHFRDFYFPSRVISAFPSDTNPAFRELFGTAKTPGVEDRYYDRALNRIIGGKWDHMVRPDRATDKSFHSAFDYEEHPRYGALMYVAPYTVSDHDINRCREVFWKLYPHSTPDRPIIIYVGSTDAIGHKRGREGMRRQLLLIERVVDEIICRTAGDVRVSIFSDHGNNLVYSEPMIALGRHLAKNGFRLSDRLTRERDVAVPRFGLVGDVVMYTARGNREALAEAARTLEGVDFAVFEKDGLTLVTGRRGKAIILKEGARYKYKPIEGDPLDLEPILEVLEARQQLDEQGFAGDADWFEATKNHHYPDILRRLTAAVVNHVLNTPDVLLSLEDGYCYGNPYFVRMIELRGTHGSARDTQTNGMAMSTDAPLPRFIRAGDLMESLGEEKPGDAEPAATGRGASRSVAE